MSLSITKYCLIKDYKVIVNGEIVFKPEETTNFETFIKEAYKNLGTPYPKFYKMDNLSKLAFVASEYALKNSGFIERYEKDKIAVVFGNSSSTLIADTEHQKTISDKNNYFPSPAVFVYTLPNILIGEICIKNKIFGENELFVSKEFDAELLVNEINSLNFLSKADAFIGGYAEASYNKNETLVFLIEKSDDGSSNFDVNNINNIFAEKYLDF